MHLALDCGLNPVHTMSPASQTRCRGNHGIQTMYEFGETIGGLDRCYYFGYGKDLYHFDHFMGKVTVHVAFCHNCVLLPPVNV